MKKFTGFILLALAIVDCASAQTHQAATGLAADADHVAVYTPDMAERPHLRGVMSPARDMNEDDFKTLKAWGVTLLRYQMIRNWQRVDTDRDVEEFDRWLGGKLDHLDKVVLPLSEKHGISVVIDLHTPPGGRDASSNMNMFYEEKYAGHFVKTWRRIARRFKGRKGVFCYDLINEPMQTRKETPCMDYWNLQRKAAEAVREEDPHTPIAVSGNHWGAPCSFREMTPMALSNIIYQVHMYEPSRFTHQRVLKQFQQDFAYPNAEKGWDREFLRRQLQPVRDFQLKHGARIYVGEFSAVAWAKGADQYLADCISLFEEYGWDWTYHSFREWKGWSVEYEGPDAKHLVPSEDNLRKRVLLNAFRRGAEGVSLRVGTYNIRLMPGDRGTANAWDERKADLVDEMRKLDMDVFGMQEVFPEQALFITNSLPQYAVVGEYRNADRVSGEASPVCYRKDRFEVLKSGTFWLSKTPDVPGVRGWGAACPRVCSWALLKDRRSGAVFSFANTHTDHISELARKEGMLLVIRRMREFAPEGTPIVFTGDHNCRETEEPAVAVSAILTNALYACETEPKGPWRTFNGWAWRDNEHSAVEALKLPPHVRNAKKDAPEADKERNGGYRWENYGARIDYIYVSKGVKVKSYETHSDPRPGKHRYPSDHFPVSARIVLP